jgi:hypothetical protein
MTEKVAFLMKDLVLFAVSFYLLNKDVARTSVAAEHLQDGFANRNTSAECQASKLSEIA